MCRKSSFLNWMRSPYRMRVRSYFCELDVLFDLWLTERESEDVFDASWKVGGSKCMHRCINTDMEV